MCELPTLHNVSQILPHFEMSMKMITAILREDKAIEINEFVSLTIQHYVLYYVIIIYMYNMSLYIKMLTG